jgi:indolepyruvate ferredoxin oxidoreductase beta subunit
MNNILLCGVGGQGSILASKLIALAAMNKKMMVRSAETIGMAQRGGSVVSHVRTGEMVYSPMIAEGQADLMIAFEPGEAMRNLRFLKPDGCLVTTAQAVMPVTASLGMGHYNQSDTIDFLKKRVASLYLVDGEKICAEAGSPKVLNTALLGAAAKSGKLGLTLGDLEKAVKSRLPEKLHEMNLKAMKKGYETEKQQ